MRGYFFIILLFVTVGARSLTADTAPNWSERYQVIKAELIAEFPAPKVGDTVTISRRVGGDLTGRLSKITKNSVTVNGRTYESSSLTKECCRKIFAEVSVPAKALKLAKAEKAAYEKAEADRAVKEAELKVARAKEVEEAEAKAEAKKAAKAEEIARVKKAAYNKAQAEKEEKQRLKREKEAKARLVAERVANTNHLNFKGLRIGMSHDDIDWLVRNTEWKYTFASQVDKKEKYMFLSSEQNADVKFKSLASKGIKGDKEYYEWKGASAQFYNNKVYLIDVDSQSWSANYIDSSLKTWLRMTHKALSVKYGKPTKVPLSIDEINIFSFKTGYNVFLSKWKTKNKCVILAIGEDESKFYGKVRLVDLAVQERIESQTKVETLL